MMVTFIDNVILGIALSLPLGPVNLEILRRGLMNGLPESLKTAIGGFCAEFTYFALVILGLARFADSFMLKIILGSLGVIFLVHIGYENLKDYFGLVSGNGKKKMYKNPFVAGYLLMFLHPLNLFMWVGIIGGNFAQNGSLWVCSGVLLGIIMTLLFFVFISKLGNKVINAKRMRYVSLLAGLFLVFYGLRLLHNLMDFFR